MKRWVLFLAAALVAAGITGCAGTTQTINQTDRFAQAGIAFADTVPPLIDESFALTVRLDSHQLVEARPLLKDMTRPERFVPLETSNDALIERLEILRDVKRHSQVLKRYFQALQSLAQSDAPAGIGQATGGLVTELGSLSGSIKSKLGGSLVGGNPLSSFIPQAVTLAVTGIQSAILNKELQEHGENIERELAFLSGLFGFLDESAQADFDALQAAATRDNIDLPFVGDGKLPSNWARRREDAFKARLEFVTLSQARQAAEALRMNFIALTEGKLSAADVSALINDVANVVALFEAPK